MKIFMPVLRFLPLFSLVLIPTPVGGDSEQQQRLGTHAPEIAAPQTAADQNGISSSRSS
jgi:hypothetical protein